jgi:hypothetical protein
MRSVGAEEWSLRTDRVTAPNLADKLSALAEDRDSISASLAAKVAVLRSSLADEFDRIAHLIA